MTPQHVLLLCIIAVVAIASASEIDCNIVDFQDGNLGQLSGSCSSLPGVKQFVVQEYDGSFEGPADNNGFYATTASGIASCVRYSEKLTITDSEKITLNFFKSGSKNGFCLILAIDANSSGQTVLDRMILDVVGDGSWVIEEIMFNALDVEDTIWLEIICEDLEAKDSFFAIDYIEIGSNNPDDCKEITTTTPEPDTTTLEPDTTTLEPDTSTLEPDTTTLDPDTTTLDPDTTTTIKPDTTTLDPDTTTPDPDTTTLDPDTTTLDPDTTTLDPDTTTLDPDTTTLDPDTTTTIKPDTTTLDPDTTTLDPDTTTLDPDTTTLDPDTTTLDPDTTTLDPDTTTLDPDTTTLDPDTTTTSEPDTTTTTDGSSIPSIPKPQKDPRKLQRLMAIIGVSIGSGLTIWLLCLTIFVLRLPTIPVVSPVKDDAGLTIPRLQVQKLQVDEVGKCVIDISGVVSRR